MGRRASSRSPRKRGARATRETTTERSANRPLQGEVKACHHCRGEGATVCDECDGAGHGSCPDGCGGDPECPECDGREEVSCLWCDGTGGEWCVQCFGTGAAPAHTDLP